MPRYFFSSEMGIPLRDADGEELPNAAAARAIANQMARQLSGTAVKLLWVVVRDARGVEIFRSQIQ